VKFPPKKEVLLALLAESRAFVQLDGRAAGVELPEWLRSDPRVMLELGYDMPVPIPDLEIDDQGFRCTLSFRRTPFLCRVPWSAVYCIIDDERRGAVYVEDMPSELRVLIEERATPAAAAEERTIEELVPPSDPEPSSPKPSAPTKKPRPSHLKLVK
jgi:hypothetical protein